MEFRPDGTELYNLAHRRFQPPSGRRNGHILFAANNVLTEMDTSGKVLRSIPLPQDTSWAGVQDLPDGRFLVCSSGSGLIVEVDGTGTIKWQTHLPGACGISGLPNGRTLVGTGNGVV